MYHIHVYHMPGETKVAQTLRLIMRSSTVLLAQLEIYQQNHTSNNFNRFLIPMHMKKMVV